MLCVQKDPYIPGKVQAKVNGKRMTGVVTPEDIHVTPEGTGYLMTVGNGQCKVFSIDPNHMPRLVCDADAPLYDWLVSIYNPVVIFVKGE